MIGDGIPQHHALHLKYVAEMLDEDEDFLHDCSIEMFSEDGRLSAYDTYPASELSETIVVFTEDH